MSFTSKQLKEHCNRIIKEPSINNKIVVLCEGFFKTSDNNEALELKEQAETTQDASFYYQATPKWWRKSRKSPPEFFPCGSQQNVIEAYFYLKNLHKITTPIDSYLNTDKLFSLVDIDFKKDSLLKTKKKYSDILYPFDNLEAIYDDIYLDGMVNKETQDKHKLWVTGFLHKEAYFFTPELRDILSEKKIDLDEKYRDILNGIPTTDFSIDKAKKRIAHHKKFNQCKSLEDFKDTWLLEVNKNLITEKNQLIYALLTVAKSKSIWEKIKPNTTAKNKEIKEYRDNLSLAIASKFYAKEPQDSQHHLPSFFNALLTAA